MREYKLKLKPQKCAFTVSSSRLLGFIVSRRCIEVNHKKVSKIIDFCPPKNLKQLRILRGKGQAVRRFIYQLANITFPFSQLLKKGEKFIWYETFQKDLDNMKRYLTNALILSPYKLGKIFSLYVSKTLNLSGEILAQKDNNNKERVTYYISKTLLAYETRYTPIEMMCFNIIFSTKKLIYYILGNTTYVIAQVDPLRYLMYKSYLSGRDAKWVIFFQEFDLVFLTQKSIKGQDITYFIINHP